MTFTEYLTKSALVFALEFIFWVGLFTVFGFTPSSYLVAVLAAISTAATMFFILKKHFDGD